MFPADWCRIRWVDVRDVPTSLTHTLSDAERARVARLLRPADRARSTAAAVLLRQMVAAASGVPAGQVQVDRTCPRCGRAHGRPRLPGLGLDASITHCGDLAGVAVSSAGAVGLDIEPVEPDRVGRLGSRLLAPGERAAGPADLLRYWTRKEAVVKATGEGIGIGLSRIVVSPPHQAPRLLSYPGRPNLSMRLADLRGRPGHLASAAVVTDRPVRFSEAFHQW